MNHAGFPYSPPFSSVFPYLIRMDGVLCHCGFYGFVWWRPWNEPANGRTQDRFVHPFPPFSPWKLLFFLCHQWINISRETGGACSRKLSMYVQNALLPTSASVFFPKRSKARNRAPLEKVKCFGETLTGCKLTLPLAHSHSFFSSLDLFLLFLSLCFLYPVSRSPSEWPVYLSWFMGSEWALLGSDWGLGWYERVLESVGERGGRKEGPGAVEESFKTTVNEEQKWMERLRGRTRREYLYSVTRLIDSFALALFWLHALYFSCVSATCCGLS